MRRRQTSPPPLSLDLRSLAYPKASAKLPGKLEQAAFLKLVQKDDSHDQLLNEMEEINQETADLPSDIVTQEEISDSSTLSELNMILDENEKKYQPEEKAEKSDEESSESDVEFNEDDMKSGNPTQRLMLSSHPVY